MNEPLRKWYSFSSSFECFFCWISMVSQSSNGLNPSHRSWTTWMARVKGLQCLHRSSASCKIQHQFFFIIELMLCIFLWPKKTHVFQYSQETLTWTFRYHESVAETMEPSFSCWISGRCLWRQSPRKTIGLCQINYSWLSEILRENYQGCMKNNIKSGISTNLNWLDFCSPSTALANHCNNNWTEAVGRCKRWQVLPLYIGNSQWLYMICSIHFISNMLVLCMTPTF